MQEKIDLRGMTQTDAIAAIDNLVASAQIKQIEITTADEAISAVVVEHINSLGATVEEVLTQADSQCIMVKCAHKLKQKVYVVGRDKLGHGNMDIGTKLITAYFNVSAEYPLSAKKMFFLNTGVNLTLKDAATLDGLKQLEHLGCEIFVCGTCLDFFGVRDQLAVGKIGTMHDLLAMHHGEDEVITL